MSHILKGLSKRNTHIPHIVLFDEDKWQKTVFLCLFWGFQGWRTFLESDPQIHEQILILEYFLGYGSSTTGEYCTILNFNFDLLFQGGRPIQQHM